MKSLLNTYVEDLKQHTEYMNSVTDTFTRFSRAPKSSPMGQALRKVESDFEKFKAPKRFIPKPIAQAYMRETRIALDYIHSLNISAKWEEEKNRLAKVYNGESYRGFALQENKPSFYMSGQFAFMILQSVKNYDTPSKKILSVVSIFNIGLRNIFDSDVLSPYRAIVKDENVEYLYGIAAHLMKRGAVTRGGVRGIRDISRGGVGAEGVTDKRFFGLTQAGQEKILRQTKNYIARYYKDSLTTGLKLSKTVVGQGFGSTANIKRTI